jgi:putative endonuclease
VEVKTRSSTAFGLPEDSVTPAKQAHLLAAAQAYLLEHPELDGDWRVDVIAIHSHPDPGQAQITHFENAVSDA